MPTLSADVEKRIQLAIKAVREGIFDTWTAAVQHYYVNYDLFSSDRTEGRLTTRGEGRIRSL